MGRGWPQRLVAGGLTSLAALGACSVQDTAGVESAQAQTALLPARIVMPAAVARGKEPGEAFITRMKDGFDDETQYLGDYSMDYDWIATRFTPDNVIFDGKAMTLEIEKRRSHGLPYAGAEFQRTGFYGFGRYEAVMRPAKGSGIVTGFFTHTDEYFDDPHDEIDFEFLGKDTGMVALNYFRDGEAAGSKEVELGFDYSEAYHLYAFEWTPTAIRWFVDGEMVHEATVENAPMPMPSASGRVIANIWSGKGDTLQWTGPPTFKKSQASFLCMSHVPMGQAALQCSDTFVPPVSR